MHRSARTRLLLSGVVCLLVGLGTAFVGSPILAIVAAWIGIAATYSVLTWHGIRDLPPGEVCRHATRDEPGRRATHLALVLTSLFSLIGVGVLLTAGAGGGAVPVEALVGTASVAASWVLVHLVFTMRYAGLYYEDVSSEAVDFATDDPDYQDFAYLAYTLGMTYQVSDTTLRTKAMRRTALRHAMLSYLLGAVVIASTINVVVQLASSAGGG